MLYFNQKSEIRALDRSGPRLPILPRTPKLATHVSKRNGSSSLLAALELASGKLIGSLHAHQRAVEFKTLLHRLTRTFPPSSMCT